MQNNFYEEQNKSSEISYMPWVALMFFLTVGLLFIYIPYYLRYSFSSHRELIYKIKNADNSFAKKEYFDALVNYINIVNEYPDFEYGIKQIIFCSFSLINLKGNDDCFDLGMYYLSRLPKVNKYLLTDIEKYLPQSHKKQFIALLK